MNHDAYFMAYWYQSRCLFSFKCVSFDDSEVVKEIKLSNAIADSIEFVLRDSLVEKRLNEEQHKLD